jgi:hypothetical protein
MRSKLPAAEAFEDWVVGTVLPAIRKDGGYVRGEEEVETEADAVTTTKPNPRTVVPIVVPAVPVDPDSQPLIPNKC